MIEINIMQLPTIKKLVEGGKDGRDSLIEETETVSSKIDMEMDLMNKKGKHKKASKVPREEQESEKDRDKKKSKDRQKSVFKMFFQYTMQRKYLAVLMLLLSVCYGVSVTLIPLQIGTVLDFITLSETQPHEGTLQDQIAKLGTMIAVSYVFALLRFLATKLLEQFLVIDMRKDVFKKFMHFDMHFYEKYKTGELVMRLTSNISQVKSAVSNNLAYLFRSLIMTVFTLIILFTISWRLALLIIGALPIYAFLSFYYSKTNKKLNKQIQDIMGVMSSNLSQKIHGIILVKAYANEQKEVQKHQKINQKQFSVAKRRIVLNAMYITIIQSLPFLSIMLVLYIGGKLILQSTSSIRPGQLSSFIMYCSTIASNTSAISSSYTTINDGIYSVQNLFDMLQYTPLLKEYQGHNTEITGSIECVNVNFQYPMATNPVFQNLCLSIRSGEYIAFVGESGSGKSTIAKLLLKFYQPQSGSILFDDHDSNEMNINHLRKQIGFVDQAATLFSGTIEQNITYGLQTYTSQQLQRAASLSGCLQFLTDTRLFSKGFQSEVGEKGSSLSGGQRQRISIARALIRNPKIIIFDEATSALDANSQKIVQDSIQNIAKTNRNTTVIVIAHRLSTVINAHRIYVMKSGCIVQMGSHQKLLQEREGYYFQLVQKQLNEKKEN